MGVKREQMQFAYGEWLTDRGDAHTYVTDDPYPKILLSRAMGYVDQPDPSGAFTVTAQDQFNAYVIRNPANRQDRNGDGREDLYFTFSTSIHEGNPFFDQCLFNDRILTVTLRILGDDLGVSSTPRVMLGWGDQRCTRGSGCGTTFVRSQEAFSTLESPGKYRDDLRAYQVQPKSA